MVTVNVFKISKGGKIKYLPHIFPLTVYVKTIKVVVMHSENFYTHFIFYLRGIVPWVYITWGKGSYNSSLSSRLTKIIHPIKRKDYGN